MEVLKGQSNRWIDITGQKFNYLTIVKYVGGGKWQCKCDCGNLCIISTAKITTNHTKSCGCIAKNNALKHGGVNTREYNIWSNMKSRCNNPNNTSYNNYGGRGITVCKEWDESFEQFIKDMGKCPINYSIERLDNDLGYFKVNCIWASSKSQSLNKRSNKLIEFQGIKRPLKEWCDLLQLDYKKVFARINQLKWPIEKALINY